MGWVESSLASFHWAHRRGCDQVGVQSCWKIQDVLTQAWWLVLTSPGRTWLSPCRPVVSIVVSGQGSKSTKPENARSADVGAGTTQSTTSINILGGKVITEPPWLEGRGKNPISGGEECTFLLQRSRAELWGYLSKQWCLDLCIKRVRESGVGLLTFLCSRSSY